MQIELSPELEAIVRRKVEAGEFDSPDACVAGALQILDEEDRLDQEYRDEMRLKIEEGWQQAERGELLTSEEVWKSLEATKVKWLAANGRNAA